MIFQGDGTAIRVDCGGCTAVPYVSRDKRIVAPRFTSVAVYGTIKTENLRGRLWRKSGIVFIH